MNSAGVNDGGRLLDLDPAMWHKVLDVNLFAAFLCIQRAGRAMREAGTGGVIVNVNSINADIPMRTHAPYCVSKAGLTMLTKVAAMELADHGVRVLGIAPGITDTPLAAGIMSRPEIRAEVDKYTALPGAMGTPAAMADVVHFLASDAAAWMTGETVVVDGGQQLLGLPDVARLLSPKKDT